MAGVEVPEILTKSAISDVQRVLKGVDQRLVIDGIWGPLSSEALNRVPEDMRIPMEKKLTAAGVSVARAVTTASGLTLSAIAQKAIAAGITGDSLVNFLTTLRMESNFNFSRRESHVYKDPARAREMFVALRSMSDDGIRGLVNSGPRVFFEAVYGPYTAKGKEIGNRLPGDGYLFRGNGPIQITGRANHERLEMETGIPAASDPDVLSRNPDDALQSAIWYWKRFVMSKGKDLNIVSATKVVNPRLVDVGSRIAMARHYSTMKIV